MIEIGKVTEDSFCWRLMYLHLAYSVLADIFVATVVSALA